MTINKSNFEAYMLDYLEGNLDPLLSAELMAYLAENPGLDVLPEYREEFLVRDDVMYQGKNILKKEFSDVTSITVENFEEFCIASVEGCLDEKDQVRLKNYIARYPEKQKVLDDYLQLKLLKDHTVVFTGKEKLKRAISFPFPYRRFLYVATMAAAVALLVFFVTRNRTLPDTEFISTLDRTDSVPEMPLATTSEEAVPKPHLTLPSPMSEENTDEITTTERDIPPPEPIHPIYAGAFTPYEPPLSQRITPVMESDLTAVVEKTHEIKAASSTTTFLGGIVKKLNVWKAAESAVSGFNYLTESQISISKQTDKTGKLTGIALDTETYRFSGNKLK